MSTNPELDIRCDYALYRVLGAAHEHRRIRSMDAAERCGYGAYPNKAMSPYFQDEPELFTAYQKGWRQAEKDKTPRTREELLSILEKMDQQASRGCGQFYELYEQNFTLAVNRWLPTLREGEEALVRELLQATVYCEHPAGHWEYDQEENDVHFVSNEE